MNLTLEFSGSFDLFDSEKKFKSHNSINQEKKIKPHGSITQVKKETNEQLTISKILNWMLVNLFNKNDHPDILILNGTVQRGILVLLNETESN